MGKKHAALKSQHSADFWHFRCI